MKLSRQQRELLTLVHTMPPSDGIWTFRGRLKLVAETLACAGLLDWVKPWDKIAPVRYRGNDEGRRVLLS